MTTEEEQLAGLARALAHPARVRIVRLLLEHGNCICGTLVDELGLAQSTVSEHLRILKAAGIIRGTIERPRVCYALEPESVEPLERLLGEVAHADPRDPDACGEGNVQAVPHRTRETSHE